VGGLRQARVASVDVVGPDMAPHTPPRSERPGKPVALLDHPRVAHRRLKAIAPKKDSAAELVSSESIAIETASGLSGSSP
jgi:hypothetical protein